MSASPHIQSEPRAGHVPRAIQALTAGLVLLLWVGVAIGLIYIDRAQHTTDSLAEVVRAVADESVEVTNRYLGEGEAAGRMASNALRASDGELDTILIETTLLSIVAAHASLDGVFFGMPNGDFYYVTRSETAVEDGLRIRHIRHAPSGERTVTEQQINPDLEASGEGIVVDDDYDPRDRPWYPAALDRGEGWTSPYLFSSSQEQGVTRYQAVNDRSGELLGVVGVDVRMADLTQFLADRVPSENGEAVILDDDGSIIAGLPTSAMSFASRRTLAQQVGQQPQDEITIAELSVADQRQVAALAPVGIDSQWTLAVSAPEGDFFIGIGAFLTRTRLLLPLLGLILTALVAALGLKTTTRIERLQKHAITDPLTALLNRGELRRLLADQLEDGSEHRIAAVALDLDDFGRFNDELGHEVGDQVLVGVARRLAAALRPDGFVGRMRSDEFLVVFALNPDEDPIATITALTSRVTSATLRVEGSELDLVLSAGIAVREPGERKGLETVLRQADLALLTAKRDKPGIVLFSEEMAFPSLRDAKRSSELRTAVTRGDFEFFFQPEVDLLTGYIVGAEALMRWRTPTGALVSADVFIHDMERLGIVDLLASELIRTSCELAERINDRDFTLRINLTATQLRNNQTMQMIADACHGSPVSWCIEITERTMVESTTASRDRLEALVADGVDLALDDFGTGYSSLGELANLPITTIKIDAAFVGELTPATASTSLASAIADIADRLSLNLVAEGIERAEQHEALRQIGCRHGQGFLFGEAMPLDEFMVHHSLTQQRLPAT